VHPSGPATVAFGAFADRDGWRHERAAVRGVPSAFGDVEPEHLVHLAAETLAAPADARWKASRSARSQLVLGVDATGVEVESMQLLIIATGINMILQRDIALVDARLNALLLERARIASDIHDGVCQEVGTLLLQLQVLDQLIDRDPPRARSLLQDIERSADLCAQNLRSAVMHLAPVTPDNAWHDGGLRAFLDDVALGWGMHIDFELCGDLMVLDPEAVALVFACIQEGLTNIRKHGTSKQATVRITFEPERIRADVISDAAAGTPDGETIACAPFGHGVSLMQGRARLLGGDVRFAQRRRHTTLSLELPL
jgi:signal transduction histidine kinase